MICFCCLYHKKIFILLKSYIYKPFSWTLFVYFFFFLRRFFTTKTHRINYCYQTNQFDLYSNLFNERAIIEEEEKEEEKKSGKRPPSYHSKYITTILPGGIAPSAIRHRYDTKNGTSFALDGSERGMRKRGLKLKGLRGSRSPPRL